MVLDAGACRRRAKVGIEAGGNGCAEGRAQTGAKGSSQGRAEGSSQAGCQASAPAHRLTAQAVSSAPRSGALPAHTSVTPGIGTPASMAGDPVVSR